MMGADCYGQTSLLVGPRSSAERRCIEGGQAQSASGYFVRRRYSACSIDSCRIVYFVGQPTMNWRRGLFRLWIVGSALFVIAVAFICYSEIKSYAEVPWAKLEMCATIAFGIPLVVLILGWAFLGSAAKRP